MRMHPASPVTWPRLRSVGRFGLALAAGGAFAAFAWDPSSASKSAGNADASRAEDHTAGRQDTVKEDGVSPQLDLDPAWYRTEDQRVLQDEGRWGLREEDRWGLIQGGARKTPWTADRCGADTTARAKVGDATSTTAHEESYAQSTTGVYPRAPPRDRLAP